ncbi:GNAT family N-acetyltransferase [Subtercola boreus]|uniref:GNAT family N-acetyltransferase n=1 Tax=Subtercola boreus TaxID=120213 RepID=UPI00209C1484|nr:GNAT family N-acetyltransferase [Subtercola boreus]
MVWDEPLIAGLDEPTVQFWVEPTTDGEIIGSTGFELSEDRKHALIRSVAVAPAHRTAGSGSRLARYALHQAYAAGSTRAWLFSRRSGPFWQKLGFTSADRYALASALPEAHQVRLFVERAARTGGRLVAGLERRCQLTERCRGCRVRRSARSRSAESSVSPQTAGVRGESSHGKRHQTPHVHRHHATAAAAETRARSRRRTRRRQRHDARGPTARSRRRGRHR